MKWEDGERKTRFSPRLGPSQDFGPFLHSQKGLWREGDDGTDWNCFRPQVTKISLEPGTYFAGLYAEVLSVSLQSA